MREAVGQTFLYYVVITFVLIIALILIGSLSYSKGFKAKNRIVSMIEDNRGYDEDFIEKIDQMLMDNGYRRKSSFRNAECPDGSGGALEPTSNNFYYCVYSHNTDRGVYYTVYMYTRFEFPVVGEFVQFPVKGDTRTIYDLDGA